MIQDVHNQLHICVMMVHAELIKAHVLFLMVAMIQKLLIDVLVVFVPLVQVNVHNLYHAQLVTHYVLMVFVD